MKGFISNLSWTTAAMVVTKLVRIASTFLLARMLVPASFGVVAIASIILELLNELKEFGFGAAFIHKSYTDPAEEQLAANTTFWTCALSNFAGFAILFLMAPEVGSLFGMVSCSPVIRVLSFSLLIEVFGTVPALLLMKRMRFKSLALREIVQAAAYGLIATTLAALHFGVWSLVYGQLAASFLAILVLWRATEWRPRFEYCPAAAVAFFHFGKYVWMLTMLDTFGGGLDRLIIGHIYGPGPLGLYTMGYMIATMVTLQIATLIHKIAYPYFCAIRADPLQLQKAVETSYNYITLASIPAALGISSIAPLFVKVVLTSKWAGAVPLVGIFALFGIFLAMAALVTPLMQAIGRPAIPLYILVSQYLLKAAALFLLSGFGISGIGWAVLGVQILATAVSIIIMCQSTGVRLFAIGNAFLRPFTAGLVMSLAVLSFLNAAGLHESRAGAVILAAALVLGAVTFLGASLLVNRGPMLALFALLVQRLRRIRRFNVNPVESPTPFADSSVTP